MRRKLEFALIEPNLIDRNGSSVFIREKKKERKHEHYFQILELKLEVKKQIT